MIATVSICLESASNSDCCCSDLSAHFVQLLTDFKRVRNGSRAFKDSEILRFFCPQIAQPRVLIDVLFRDILRVDSIVFDSQPQLADFRRASSKRAEGTRIVREALGKSGSPLTCDVSKYPPIRSASARICSAQSAGRLTVKSSEAVRH